MNDNDSNPIININNRFNSHIMNSHFQKTSYLLATSLSVSLMSMSTANANLESSSTKTLKATHQQLVNNISTNHNDYLDDLPDLSSLKNNPKLHLTLPTIEHFTTPNGVKVSFFRSVNLPIVDIDIRFNAGSARDEEVRKDGLGIANMVAQMLTQGTQNLDENDYNLAVEQYGLKLNSAAHKDMFVVSMRSLSDSKNLDPAIGILSQTLTKPRFSGKVLERNKARILVNLKQQQQSPSAVANIRFNQELYGNHPYAHPTSGNLKTVPTITEDDLRTFQENFLVAHNASMSITGDLTIEEAKNIANQITKDLKKGKKASPLPTPVPQTKQKYVHIPFNSTQTTVIMGQLGKKRSTDPNDWQALNHFSIANKILAGSNFNSRLMKEIRKKRGLTYGIYGSMTPMQSQGSYTIRFSTRNDKLNEGIKETIKLINTARQNGLTDDEISLTKEELINSFPMSFTSNSGINNLLGMMNFYDLPDQYLANYLNRIEQSTASDINGSLKDNIDPNKFVIVTVGKPFDASQLNNHSKRTNH